MSLPSVKTWREKTYDWDIPYNNKKSQFLCDYWNKSDGIFAEVQIFSLKLIILLHIQISSQLLKLLMLTVWL